MSAIKPGDRIDHKCYGTGTVNQIVNQCNIDWVVIKFDKKPKRETRKDGTLAIPVDYIRRIDS